MSPIEIEIRSACWLKPQDEGGMSTGGPVDLVVRAGEFVSVLGPPRSGKSMLIRLVAGLQQPDSGEILIAGRKVESAWNGLGIVFPSPVLMPWRSALGNILIQGEIRRQDLKTCAENARQLLVMMGLEGLENQKPGVLSLAQQVRVAVCRALVHNPEMLLLDDPFGGLDAMEREMLINDFQRLIHTRQITVLLTTSMILEAVRLSSRVAVLAPDGKVAQVTDIDLPHPRNLDKSTYPRITDYCSSIRKTLQACGVLH